MTLRLFAHPAVSHPKWSGWVRWACSVSTNYKSAAELLGIEPRSLLEVPVEERPMKEADQYVPVVWTEWGWLDGAFDDGGCFLYDWRMH